MDQQQEDQQQQQSIPEIDNNLPNTTTTNDNSNFLDLFCGEPFLVRICLWLMGFIT
jgi:hypothetical protein